MMPVQRSLCRFRNVDIDVANLQLTGDGAIRPLEAKAFRQSRKLHRITPDLPLRMYLRYPRLSPNGARLAYELHESKGNVFIAGIAK